MEATPLAYWEFSGYSLTFNELLSRSFKVDGVNFASLDDVIKWKKAGGRDKDESDLKLIKSYLARKNQ